MWVHVCEENNINNKWQLTWTDGTYTLWNNMRLMQLVRYRLIIYHHWRWWRWQWWWRWWRRRRRQTLLDNKKVFFQEKTPAQNVFCLWLRADLLLVNWTSFLSMCSQKYTWNTGEFPQARLCHQRIVNNGKSVCLYLLLLLLLIGKGFNSFLFVSSPHYYLLIRRNRLFYLIYHHSCRKESILLFNILS